MAQNARIQSFFYFTSGPEEMFAPDLAVLVALVADGKLRPVIGIERNWSEISDVAELLGNRQVPGKAVLRTGDP
jgi:NADPH:quinone reductase-like Zn-dependent oxidoreductase